MAEMPDDVLVHARSIQSSAKAGGSLADLLDVDPEHLRAWEARGWAEIDRIASDTRRRIRKAEAPYVELARIAAGFNRLSAMVPATGTPSGGRPLKLTEKVLTVYVEGVLDKLSPEACAALIGVHPTTAQRWLDDGMRHLLRAEEEYDGAWSGFTEAERMLMSFAIRVARSRAEVERDIVATIDAAGRGIRDDNGDILTDEFGRPVMKPDWKAHAWLGQRIDATRRRLRSMDEEGDERSAAVQAESAKARPPQVIIQHSDTGHTNGPIEHPAITAAREEAGEDVIEGKARRLPGPDVLEPIKQEEAEETEDDHG